MEKGRLLVIAPIGGFTNGADIALNHQVSFLIDRGYEIVFVSPAIENPALDDFLAELNVQNVKLPYSYWDDGALNQLFYPHQDLETVTELVKLINEQNIDIVLSNTLNIPWGAMAAAMVNKPHIWLAHEFPHNEFSYLQEKMDFIAKFSNSVMAASPLLQETLQSLFVPYQLDYSVGQFYPYTDSSRLHLSTENGSPRLICVNAITERKNQLELLEAAAQLFSEDIKVEIVFTGYIADEAYYQRLLEFIRTQRLESSVIFASEGLDNWSKIRKSDIFINSSKMETFSLTMIEGLKLGLPMIVSDNEATQSMKALGYFDEPSVYSAGNIEELTAKIKYFLANFQARCELSASVAQKVLSEQSLEMCSMPLLTELERIKGLESPLSELTDVSAYFQQGIEHFQKVEAELIPNLHKIIQDKDRALEDQLVNQQKIVQDKDTYIKDQEARAAELQQRLLSIQNSKSYKLSRILTSPIRKLKGQMHQ
ncbi:glycosyltransferase family 4 protein [Lactovum odontotermitis]